MYNKTKENSRRQRQLSPIKKAQHEVKKCTQGVKEAENAIKSLATWESELETRKAKLNEATGIWAELVDTGSE